MQTYMPVQVFDVGDIVRCCPICFEPWTNSGIHRLASLKCGHLFGQSCLEKWLKGHGSRCPQCNTKAKWKDIRVIYATKSLRSVDTSETERVMMDLEKERSARQKAELEAAQTRLRYQMALLECNKIKEELDRQRQQIEVASAQASGSHEPSRSVSASQPIQTNGRYILNKTLTIRQAGGCRVMTLSPHLGSLVISQPSSSPIFPGAGVKKVSCLDFKTTQYVAVHLKEIRDLSFHPNRADGLLLSGSLDKTIKLTSLMGNTVVQTIPCPAPVWSCVWNADDQNYFYAGLSNGSCYLCDIRQPAQHVTDLNIGGPSKSPVVAMDYLPQNLSTQFRLGGLLVGQMQQSAFHEMNPDGLHKTHLLPIEGLLFSLSVEQQTRHILASHRPTVDGRPTVRHRLHELVCENVSINPTVIDNICKCRNIQTFHGGNTQKRLLRNRLIRDPSGSGGLLVCASDEASLAVHIWDTSTAHLKQKLNTMEPVLDICSIHFNDQHLLVSLTERQIAVYQYR